MTENTPNEEIDFEIDLGEIEEQDSDEELEIDLSLDAPEGEEEAEPEPETDIDLSEDEDEQEDEQATDEGEAVEAALAELREELESKFGDWYVVHTYSGMENRVKQNIDSRAQSLNMEDYIFETVVPTEQVVEVRNNNRKTVTRSVLPGYVLIRMELTDDSWGVVRHTPSVTGFVGQGQNPVPLSVDEVLHMLTPSVKARVAAEHVEVQPKQKKKVEVVDFSVGDSVMVTDGPFAGVHATITEINPNSNRLRALVEILGRETPVDLEFRQVSKVV